MQLVSVKPYPITQIATTLSFKIVNSDAEAVTIYYELRRADGMIVEADNKTFPITALSIIASQPMDINGLNALLAAWNLEAEI